MPPFSEEDINAARRRVQEMKNRASRFSPDDISPAVHTNINEAAQKKSNHIPKINENKEEQEKVNIAENEDNDRNNSFFIILAVLMLLSKENADNKLILALLYLLL